MSFSSRDIWKDFSKRGTGMVGIGILVILIAVSIITFVTIPQESFKKWNDPANWLSYPKSAAPSWINYFLAQKIPEHLILMPHRSVEKIGNVNVITDSFETNYYYSSFPSDFIYKFKTTYSGSPLLQISVTRPDGIELKLDSISLPFSSTKTEYSNMVFSTDPMIAKNVQYDISMMKLPNDIHLYDDLAFSKFDENKVLQGHYVFRITMYSMGADTSVDESKLILGGKVYGLMGTDELRRDLAMGLLWGTPLALFIGITVAIGSVSVGLLYGVFAGFKGNITDESMMRFNDIIYAMPALPLLIILAVTIGNSIFLIVGFLVIFGWVGIAKVSRSMAMQIKTLQYVEASKLMGQKDHKIIFKHILPQLLPYAFASIAISVPAAITTEAGLSFLGLGDPTFPTWGQLLHDASAYNAAARGMWWWILPPGIMIAITGLAFVFIGNTIDSIVNPKLKR